MSEPNSPNDLVIYEKKDIHLTRDVNVYAQSTLNFWGNVNTSNYLLNWKSENTRKLRKALLDSSTGLSHNNLLFVGDSIVAGVDNGPEGSLSPRVDAFPYRLASKLGATGEGPVFANNNNRNGATDTRWAFGANWIIDENQLYKYTVTPGATATFTSLASGTIVEVYYVDTGDGFSITIDGGAPTVVSPVGSNNVLIRQFTGLPNTVHSVVITAESVPFTFLLGVAVRDTTGLSVVNAALGGANSVNFVDVSGICPAKIFNAVAPKASFVHLNINDSIDGTPVGTFVSQTESIVDHLKTYGDVILLLGPPINPAVYPNKSVYDELYRNIALDNNIPCIDLEIFFIDWASYSGDGYPLDNAHPNKSGQEAIARVLFDLISRI